MPAEMMDVEEMNGEGTAKKGLEDAFKIDKYLTENLYYNSEHHQGKSNILDWESPARI